MMMIHSTTPHELASASLQAYIQAGAIAHHSGRADDHYRHVVKKVRELTGATAERPSFYVELHDTSDGRVRAIIDTESGYWNSIIPAADAATIRRRAPLC